MEQKDARAKQALKKTVEKKVPFDRWRVVEMQRYFEDMSAEGFHVRNLESGKNTFEVGEPENIRYRIDVARKNYGRSREEQLGFYARAGWKHIGWTEGYHLYRFTAPESPHIPTEVFEPQLLVRTLRRKATLGLLLNSLSLMGGILLIAAVFLNHQGTEGRGFTDLFQGAALLLLLSASPLQNIRIYRYARDLEERLARGEDFQETASFEELERRYRIRKAAFLIVSLSLVVLQTFFRF